jgi:hypothetical protein
MAIPCSQQKLHTGQRSYGKVGVRETVPIVKTSKPNYNAYHLLNKKGVLNNTFKNKFDTKHKNVNKECTAVAIQVL